MMGNFIFWISYELYPTSPSFTEMMHMHLRIRFKIVSGEIHLYQIDNTTPRITGNFLTHLSLASLLWDIGKQYSPIWGYSVCLENFHRKIE